MPENPRIGRTLAALRSIRGWTQAELADASGLSRSQISRYERGAGDPTPRTLRALLGVFGLTRPEFERLTGSFGGLEKGSGLSPDDTRFDVALQHVYRVWEAEEENARRHATRAGLILTAIGVFGGVGLFRFAQAVAGAGFDSRWPLVVVAIFLLAGLILIGLSALYLTGQFGSGARSAEEETLRTIVDPQEPSKDEQDFVLRDLQASLFLGLPLGLLRQLQRDEPAPGTEDHLRYQAFLVTETAARILSAKNHFEKKRIKSAQNFFWWALVAFFVGVAIFTGAGVYDEQAADESAAQSSGDPNGQEERDHRQQDEAEDGSGLFQEGQ